MRGFDSLRIIDYNLRHGQHNPIIAKRYLAIHEFIPVISVQAAPQRMLG